MAKQWKQGDVVQLESGGPHMTVHTHDPTSDTEVYCSWFTPAGDVKRDKFGPDQLIKIDE
jgi:uncharacterized protein YodC (DUF2158 family)